MLITRIRNYIKRMLKIKKYTIKKNIILTNEILGAYITNFWNDIFISIKDNKHLMLMCKVEFADNSLGYRTLGHLRRVNFDDKDLFIEYLTQRLGILNDSYTTYPTSKITFSYIIKNGLASDNRRLLQDLSNKSITNHRFNNMNLPITMDPSGYGEIQASEFIELDGVSYHRYIVSNGSKIFRIDRTYDKSINKVTILGAVDLSWIDTKISDNLIFKREIGKSIIYFMDGVRVLSKKLLNAKPFRKLTTENKLISNFIVMDIETVTINSKFTPYLICAYNGNDYITSYANESLNQKDLFNSFINQLLNFFSKDINTISIFAHNFSAFDGIFLMKQLLDYGKVEPLLHNGKLISIKLKLNIEGHKGKTIIFKDSYLLLPLSLRFLCSSFDILIPKGYFPFLLTDIFYKGILPNFENWTGITLSEFELLVNKYTNTTWNFKDEAINYCKLDCKCLYDILVKFNKLIFNEFKVNINISLTLPALAMRIYKSQFMPRPGGHDKIYQLLGNIESDIRESYTGGSVDAYIPHNRIGNFFSNIFTKLYYYDVNSLYPFIMANTPMPVGKPIAFVGDIRKIEGADAFGFFYCKITSPEYLQHPILQRRIKTQDGIRTIAGLGSWSGWIFSGEMDNAIKFGYSFEILKGYQFEKGYIFKEYVDKMYNLRMQYIKGDPMNLIAKLLMNSLYGKFGMKLETTLIDIVDTSSETELNIFKEMLDVYGESIIDFVKLDHRILTVRSSLIHYKYNEDEDMFHGFDVNIAIASAITSGARMWMSVFKKNPLFNLFYSDTDSFVIDKPLPSFMVGKELGQVKLEYVIKRAVFLAPKVYGIKTETGDEVIKVKGVNKDLITDIHIQDLENLLYIDSSKEFSQSKWVL